MPSSSWKRQIRQVLGIDIGSYEIKAILLGKTTDGYKVLSYAHAPVKKGVVSDHEIQDMEGLLESLRVIRASFPRSIKYAAAAVAGSAVMTKVIHMDALLNEDEMEAQIEVEADNLIPYPIEEVSTDFETLGVNSIDDTKVNVLLSACRTDNVDMVVDSLDNINLQTKIVDIEGYALGRSFELVAAQLPDDAKQKVVMMVNIGASMVTFTIIDDGATTFTREQAFGGEQYTHAIMSFYGMTYEEAETAKLQGDLPTNYMLEVQASFQTQLLQQIKRAIQIYETSTGEEKIDYIVLCGGTSSIQDLGSFLTTELDIKTIAADPFLGNLQANSKIKNRLQPDINKYMVACGLALRSFS